MGFGDELGMTAKGVGVEEGLWDRLSGSTVCHGNESLAWWGSYH